MFNPKSEKCLLGHDDHRPLFLDYAIRDAAMTAALFENLKRSTLNSMLTLKVPPVKKVIFSGPKTIVIWADESKTIVSCGEGEDFDRYTGFCAAVCKKLFGSTSMAKRVLKKTTKE